MTHEDAIIVGESYWLRIPDVKLDDAQLTVGNAPDSFSVSVRDDTDTQIGTGTLTENATTVGTWQVKLLAPATPQRLRLIATATKGASVGKWTKTVVVEAAR